MQNQTFDKLRPTNVLLFKSTSVSKLDLPTDFKNCIWLDHFLIGTDFAVAIYSSIPGDSLKYCGMVILSDSIWGKSVVEICFLSIIFSHYSKHLNFSK